MQFFSKKKNHVWSKKFDFFLDFIWKFSKKKSRKYFTEKYFLVEKKSHEQKIKIKFLHDETIFFIQIFSNIKSYLSAFQRHQLELQGVSENEKFFKFKTSCPSWDVIWTLIWALIWELIWDFCPPKVGATEGRNPVLIQITSVARNWTH